jgi:hypothetical protein
MTSRSLLLATNVTAPATPAVGTGADFAILRNCMADNCLDSPDRQTMVTLINYRSRPVITAPEVTDGKSGRPF